MESLLLAFTVIFPLLVYLALGYFLRLRGLWEEKTVRQMNGICFKLFLPVLLFENVRDIDLSQGINTRLMVYAAATIVVTFLAGLWLMPRLEQENSRRGVMLQALFRSNFVLFGLPVARALWGQEQLGDTAAVVALIVPLFNFLAVLSLELFRDGKIDLGQILRKIVTNPLILGAVLGFVALLLGLELPEVVDSTLTAMSRVATPLGLMILGGSFSFAATRGLLRQIAISSLLRLVIVPALWLGLGAALGFRGLAIITLLPLYGSPVATSSFAMAQQMGGDSELAGQLVVYTSVGSIVTMFLWIVALKNLALF